MGVYLLYMGLKNTVKVFGQAFFKRLAVSKGSAFGRPSQRAKSFFRRALRKGLNLQNDPVDRFAKRGNPAREGSPLPADFADYPFTEQVKTVYWRSVMVIVCCRLSAGRSLTKGSDLYAYPAGTSFCSCKRKQNTLGDTPRPHAPERPLGTAAPSRSVG
mgnify:CR=1 FL=1